MELQYRQNLPLGSPTEAAAAETATAAVAEKATQERTVTLATEQSEEDLAQLPTQPPSPDAHTCDTSLNSIHRRIASVNDNNTDEPPCLEVLQHSILHFQKGYKAVVHTVRLNYWNLLGTAGAWFLLDIVFYGNGLFSGQVLFLYFLVFLCNIYKAFIVSFYTRVGHKINAFCTESTF